MRPSVASTGHELQPRDIHDAGVVRWVGGRRPVNGWFGTNTDITERLEAERAVRESEAKVRRIAESAIVGVFYGTP